MKYRTRKLIKPADLNGNGTLFGGQVLKWIDEEASIFTICQIGEINLLQKKSTIVTKAMSEINFVSSGNLGDVIEIGCDLVSVGKTSLTICCEVRIKSSKQTIIKVDKIVFVMVDESGKPKEHGKKSIN